MRDVRDCIHRDTGISVENTVEQQRAAAASGHLVTPLSRQGVETEGGEVGWLWDWERRVLGRQGVLPAMASLVSWHLWHQCCGITLWQNASSRSGSTHAGRCDSSTLEYRTAELADETADLSHSLCDVCDGRNTPVGRSDRGNERGYAASQRHAYVMRKRGVCRAVPYGFASWWVATGADRGSGPARPPGHAAAFVCGPRGGCGVPDMPDRGTHTSTDSDALDLDARRRSGRAGRLGCGGGRPGRGSPGARTLHTHDTGIRVLVGTGRLNAIMSRGGCAGDPVCLLFAVMSRGTCELHTSIIAVAWKRRMKAGWRGKEQPAAPPLAALPQLASCKQPHGGACPGPRCAHTT